MYIEQDSKTKVLTAAQKLELGPTQKLHNKQTNIKIQSNICNHTNPK